MNIIVFGATGTVGGEVVREAVKDPEINEVTAVALWQVAHHHMAFAIGRLNCRRALVGVAGGFCKLGH